METKLEFPRECKKNSEWIISYKYLIRVNDEANTCVSLAETEDILLAVERLVNQK
jgi:hypothetical protein